MSKSKARRQDQERSLMDQYAVSTLLTCLGYASTAVKKEQLAHVSADEWRGVVELARQHSVIPLLYHRLKPLDLVLPGDLADELNQQFLKQAFRNSFLYRELGELLRLFQEKNISVIVLKGAYLAETVYENLGLRKMGDVDLLVKKDDLLRVEQELIAFGYKPEDCNRVITQENRHFVYRKPRNSLKLEIHWLIVNPSYLLQIDMEGLWSRAQPITLAQAPAFSLSIEDLLLHLCLHTATHWYNMHIRMLCDIGDVIRCYGAQLNWQEIVARARQWGIPRAVYVILWLTQELLEVAIPMDWLTSILPDDFENRYLNLAREQILDPRAAGNIVQLEHVAEMWGVKGLGHKLALMCKRLMPPREAMALKYPAPSNSWRIYLYYPAHIKDVLLRQGASLWRLLCGDPKTQAIARHTNEIIALRNWLLSG